MTVKRKRKGREFSFLVLFHICEAKLAKLRLFFFFFPDYFIEHSVSAGGKA